jgi:hypothetical protein
MNAMNLDTRKAVRDLRAVGADEPLADAIVDLFRQSAEMPDVASLATKDDITISKAELRADIANLRTELKTDGASLRAELKTEIGKLDTKVNMLMWMIGAIGGGALALQALGLALKVSHG